LIPNQIRKVLSLIAQHRVRALLMGGQACIFYGAAEFSRDIDFAILASEENLTQLRACLDELEAEVIAVPPFLQEYLEKGHAIHFRCATPEAAGLRIDVMTKLRGVDTFEKLWERRNTLVTETGAEYHLMSLPDLVDAKKTQRDKDWPMIRRLVEADYFACRDKPASAQVGFWLSELRTVELLVEVANDHPQAAQAHVKLRPLLKFAIIGDTDRLEEGLAEEERSIRELDRKYWKPLKEELEQLRLNRNRT